jgi:hypothetical protein
VSGLGRSRLPSTAGQADHDGVGLKGQHEALKTALLRARENRAVGRPALLVRKGRRTAWNDWRIDRPLLPDLPPSGQGWWLPHVAVLRRANSSPFPRALDSADADRWSPQPATVVAAGDWSCWPMRHAGTGRGPVIVAYVGSTGEPARLTMVLRIPSGRGSLRQPAPASHNSGLRCPKLPDRATSRKGPRCCDPRGGDDRTHPLPAAVAGLAAGAVAAPLAPDPGVAASWSPASASCSSCSSARRPPGDCPQSGPA